MTALAVLGLLVVVVACVDVVWTTVASGSGAGPVTGRIAGLQWRTALAVHQRHPSHAGLVAAGVTVVLGVLAVWIALVFTGWVLIFSASDGAVRTATTAEPADLVARMYFTGYTIFTLGNGDYVPGDGIWQLATVLAVGTGLLLVTLSVTYLVPVASAVATRRQLASYIRSLGATPHEILIDSWNGQSFSPLSQHLTSLTTLVHTVRQQHLAYPVLHYFHSRTDESAAAPNITNLALAVHLLRHGVSSEARPDRGIITPVERAIDAFLETLNGAHIGHGDAVPVPSLAPLAAAGIPVRDNADYRAHDEDTAERRRLLGGLLRDDGWTDRGADA